jgi:type I restriction enzyme S subunit
MVALKASNYIDILCNKATIAHYTTEKLAASPIIMPPLPEQIKIVAFLDYETAKVDGLIAKQQQLIALLDEKRQAVISHAVTKGLDPKAPMRSSGIDWLGDVPAHWETPNLFQTTVKIGDGLHSTPVYEENTGYFFVNGNNLNDGEITTGQNAKEVPFSQYIQHFIPMDRKTVLLSINGTIGKLALYRDEPVILGKSAAYINCSDEMIPEFLLFYLGSSQSRNYYDLEVTGTTIFNLSLNSIRKMKVCLPPPGEQEDIALYCEDQKRRFDNLLAKAQSAITLLKERRTALISSAVTGKIDLRDWQPPEGSSKISTEDSEQPEEALA